MANIDQNEAIRLLAASLGLANYTEPTTVNGTPGSGQMKLRLTSDFPTSTSNGTEIVGGSYAPQTITLKAVTANASVPNGAITSNQGVVSFTNMPAVVAPGVQGANIFDGNVTPRRAWYGNLSAARVLSAGDTLSFADGAVTVGLS